MENPRGNILTPGGIPAPVEAGINSQPDRAQTAPKKMSEYFLGHESSDALERTVRTA